MEASRLARKISARAEALLLERICTAPLIDAEFLRAEGVLDDDSSATTRTGDDRQDEFAF